MGLKRRVILLISILAVALCAGLVVFFLSGRSTSPDKDSAKAPTPAPTGAPALLWQDGYIGPTKVFIEGKALCIRVKWTGSRGPCASGSVPNPTEELQLIDLPGVTSWEEAAADPKNDFTGLRVGDATVKTMHHDSECSDTFWVDGVVTAWEECVAVRFASQAKEDTFKTPFPATDIIPLPPDAEQRGKLKFDEVLRVVRTHRGDVEDCLRANNIQYDTNWAVSFEWIISPDGEVIRPQIENSLGGPNAATPALGVCLLQLVSQWRFPESAEGMRIRNFRFNRFNPQWD